MPLGAVKHDALYIQRCLLLTTQNPSHLEALPTATTPPLGLNEGQLQDLFTQLKQLTAQVQKVSAQSSDVESWIWSRKSWVIGIAIAEIAGGGLYSVFLSRQGQHLKRLQNSTLIRLEFIERAIGTVPK